MPSLLLVLLQQAPSLPPAEMRPSGWVFLGVAWVFVTGLLVWSFVRVLGGRRPS